MNKALFVVSSLQPSAAARQLCLLATVLPRDRFRICVLGPASAWSEQLSRDEVSIDVLGWQRWVDIGNLLRLRDIVRQEATTVCAWGIHAAWPMVLTGQVRPSNLTLIAPFHLSAKESSADRWLIRSAKQVITLGNAEADRCRSLGVRTDRLHVVAPGVPISDNPSIQRLEGVPEEARLILTPGPIGPYRGQRESIWVLDILGYLYATLHLVLTGEGGNRDQLFSFIRACERESQVHFINTPADLRPYLNAAEVIWLPCLRSSGRYSALEAMAAGRPVVASKVAALAELITHGQTGLLTVPGDKADLARKTRQILDNHQLALDLGQAAQEQVRRHYSLEQHAKTMRQVLGIS